MGYDSGIDTVVGVTIFADQVPASGKVEIGGETFSWEKVSDFGWRIEDIASALDLEARSNQARPEVTNKWMIGVPMEGTRPTKKAIKEATAKVAAKLDELNEALKPLGIEFTQKDVILDDLTWISV